MLDPPSQNTLSTLDKLKEFAVEARKMGSSMNVAIRERGLVEALREFDRPWLENALEKREELRLWDGIEEFDE